MKSSVLTKLTAFGDLEVNCYRSVGKVMVRNFLCKLGLAVVVSLNFSYACVHVFPLHIDRVYWAIYTYT